MPDARSIAVVVLFLAPAPGPAAAIAAADPRAARLSVEAAAARLDPQLPDRDGWARDVVAALAKIGREPSAGDVCAVYAVIDLASGFDAAVRLDRAAPFDFSRALDERYGAGVAGLVRFFLRLPDGRSGSTFAARFAGARTEEEFDSAYLDLLEALRAGAPSLYATAEQVAWRRRGITLVDLDPIHTLGPMQVSLRWAARQAGAGLPVVELRRRLHSRSGGIEAGVARLLGGEQRYDDVRFLFADYNAGEFASRNAAFQHLVARLTGEELALDGDLLRYSADGTPLADSESLRCLERLGPTLDPPIGGEALRRDLLLEKRLAFEHTATWIEVRALALRKLGVEPEAARVPDLAARGPKQRAPFRVRGWVRIALSDYERCLAGEPVPLRTAKSRAAATNAHPPAAKNADAGETRSQSAPKRRLAPSAP